MKSRSTLPHVSVAWANFLSARDRARWSQLRLIRGSMLSAHHHSSVIDPCHTLRLLKRKSCIGADVVIKHNEVH
ncbi:unnamed protein product [Mycena citricolor]|uniref:Uncharacterized protein n=1 Tax=Mycena citricolor TaxID=2018698 RepID=A0AAD2HWK8_9AGAR|nr:unnamed protein product [Mycena citricolor]